MKRFIWYLLAVLSNSAIWLVWPALTYYTLAKALCAGWLAIVALLVFGLWIASWVDRIRVAASVGCGARAYLAGGSMGATMMWCIVPAVLIGVPATIWPWLIGASVSGSGAIEMGVKGWLTIGLYSFYPGIGIISVIGGAINVKAMEMADEY